MKVTKFLTLAQAAELLKVSERTLWQLAKDNAVPSFRVGKQYRFRESALDDWAQAMEGESDGK